MLRQPSPPPTEGAVRDYEVVALRHEPEVGVGIFVALVVMYQIDAVVGQRNTAASGFRAVGEQKVVCVADSSLNCIDRSLVVIARSVVAASVICFLCSLPPRPSDAK